MLAEATHDRIGRFLVAVVLQSRESLSCIRTVTIVPFAGHSSPQGHAVEFVHALRLVRRHVVAP